MKSAPRPPGPSLRLPLRICQLGFEIPHVQAVCSCNAPFLPTGGSAALSMWRRGGRARIFFLHRPAPPLPSHLPASPAVRLQLRCGAGSVGYFVLLSRAGTPQGLGILGRSSAGRRAASGRRPSVHGPSTCLRSSGPRVHYPKPSPMCCHSTRLFGRGDWSSQRLRRLNLDVCGCRAVHRTLPSHLYNPVTTSPSFMCVGRPRPGREGFSLGNRWQGWGEDPGLLTIWGLP